MRKAFHETWRSHLACLLLGLLLIGLFFSRALSSISVILLAATALVHGRWKETVAQTLRSRWMLGVILIWLIPFISGLWSDDWTEWLYIIRIKLPFLFFPFVFCGPWRFERSAVRWLVMLFLGLCLGGVIWSMAQYIPDKEAIQASYLRSKTIPTPMENDHIRFSFMVAAAVFLCAYIIEKQKRLFFNVILIPLALVFIVYLHILSARTGLVVLYLGLLVLLIHWLRRRKELLLPGLALLIALPVAAYLIFPTLKNRLLYFRYDVQYILRGEYLPGANDGGRAQSMKAGWEILQQHPVSGVGAGDIRAATTAWYDAQQPVIAASDRLYPSSEWLVYGDTAGIAGLLIFTWVMLLPVSLKLKDGVYFHVIQLGAVVCFIADAFIEGQNGILVYCFLLFGWYQWLRQAR